MKIAAAETTQRIAPASRLPAETRRPRSSPTSYSVYRRPVPSPTWLLTIVFPRLRPPVTRNVLPRPEMATVSSDQSSRPTRQYASRSQFGSALQKSVRFRANTGGGLARKKTLGRTSLTLYERHHQVMALGQEERVAGHVLDELPELFFSVVHDLGRQGVREEARLSRQSWYGHARGPSLEEVAEVLEVGVTTRDCGLAVRQVGDVCSAADKVHRVRTPFIMLSWLDSLGFVDLDTVRSPISFRSMYTRWGVGMLDVPRPRACSQAHRISHQRFAGGHRGCCA